MKPFTKRNTKRLLRVCDVVRTRLGLGDLSHEYRFKPGQRPWADCYVPYRGWRITISFYDSFFTLGLQSQLEVIVHEHLHAMLIPGDQVGMERLNEMKLPKAEKKLKWNELHRGIEVAIDHATVPILNLLMPHIKKVL